ncbi:MAG: DMT family transporter [Magnetovibrio sp.]|nr:DMT family transporter [Magnetovibrio sp.]
MMFCIAPGFKSEHSLFMTPQTHTDTYSQNMRGIVLVLLGSLMLSLMDGVMKHLLEQGYSVLQMMAVRGWFVVPLMAFWAWAKMPAGALKTKRPVAHFIRAFIGFFAPLFFFTALITLDLADATVIVFGSTFIMTVLSVPILKEHVGRHRWAAVFFGFVGVLIAANPTGDFFKGGAVYAVFASLAYALIMIMTRWLGKTESTFAQVFYFNAWAAFAATVISFPDVSSIPYVDFGFIVLLGALSVAGHFCLTHAFSIAPIGLVAPFEYSIIVWATLIGFFVWGDIPGSEVILGGAVIVASGLYLLHREHGRKGGPA